MSDHRHEVDWVAAMDQAREAVKDMAPLLFSYYQSLLDSGFKPGEALMLTSRFQTELMTPPKDDE